MLKKNATFGTVGRSPGSPGSKTCHNTGHLVSRRRKKKNFTQFKHSTHIQHRESDQEELNQTSAEEQQQQPRSSLAPADAEL